MDSDECERALEAAEKRIEELDMMCKNLLKAFDMQKLCFRNLEIYSEKQAQCIKEMREALAEAEPYINTVLSAYDESFQRHPSKERERAVIVSDLENIHAVLARWPE